MPCCTAVADPDAGVRRAIADLEAALDEAGAPHMLIGGLAVILRGVVRQTDDVDATVWAEGVDLKQLIRILKRHRIAGRIPDLESFARAHQVLQLIHRPSGTPIDLSLAWLPFEKAALKRAERIVIDEKAVTVAVAEDLIIYKSVAWRDRDRADIERLLLIHGRALDLGNIRKVVAQFAEALEEPERLANLDSLIARALPGRRSAKNPRGTRQRPRGSG